MKKLATLLILLICIGCFFPCLSEEETSSESNTTDSGAETSEYESTASDLIKEEEQPAEESEETAEVILTERNIYTTWYGVVPTDEQGMAIPILYQTDYPQTICIVDGLPRSVASSGCGATSASMVIAYLTGDTVQNPYTLFCEAVDSSYYYGAGLSHEAISWLLKRHGVQGEWIYNNRQAIYDALNSGYPVIAHMGKGIFTNTGHYVVLRGVTENGKILLNDPISPTKTGRAFPISTLMTQAKNKYSFCICRCITSDEEVDEQVQEPIG